MLFFKETENSSTETEKLNNSRIVLAFLKTSSGFVHIYYN